MCVFRISGEVVQLDGLIALCPVEPIAVFRKGELRSSRPNSSLCSITGLNIDVSKADFHEFDQQKRDAIAFLGAHDAKLRQMRQYAGVTYACIDFAIDKRDVFVQSDRFEVELLSLLASLDISLELSQYPSGKRNKKFKQYGRARRKVP